MTEKSGPRGATNTGTAMNRTSELKPIDFASARQFDRADSYERYGRRFDEMILQRRRRRGITRDELHTELRALHHRIDRAGLIVASILRYLRQEARP